MNDISSLSLTFFILVSVSSKLLLLYKQQKRSRKLCTSVNHGDKIYYYISLKHNDYFIL